MFWLAPRESEPRDRASSGAKASRTLPFSGKSEILRSKQSIFALFYRAFGKTTFSYRDEVKLKILAKLRPEFEPVSAVVACWQ